MKAWGLLGVLACAVALAAPTTATAKPGYFVSDHFHFARAYLQGSNGFHLRIEGFSTNVNVTVQKGNEEVSYSSSAGQLRHDRMRVRLPGVGRIDVRFHEQSRSRKDPADNCEGPGELVRHGFFEGRVKIEGEREFTRVDVAAVRGTINDDPEQICRREDLGRSSASGHEELLEAATPRGSGVLSFFANEWAPWAGSRPVFFDARLIRRRGQMAISNSVGGFTEDPKAVIVEKPPLSGAVDPPGPFTGTATFQREPDGSFSWLGDLAAELPGIGPVQLAGPSFEAIACVDNNCKGSPTSSRFQFEG